MSDFLRTVFIWVALGTLIFFVFNNIENAREEISTVSLNKRCYQTELLKSLTKVIK